MNTFDVLISYNKEKRFIVGLERYNEGGGSNSKSFLTEGYYIR